MHPSLVQTAGETAVMRGSRNADTNWGAKLGQDHGKLERLFPLRASYWPVTLHTGFSLADSEVTTLSGPRTCQLLFLITFNERKYQLFPVNLQEDASNLDSKIE